MGIRTTEVSSSNCANPSTPDWNKPFLVYCDASREAVGSTLSQLDENGHDHPIHFASKQLTSAEKNYTMTEQEGLKVIFSL